ncbi:MAG: periplasmic heavy metal sensor [Desulfurivibrionaceae bacterium]
MSNSTLKYLLLLSVALNLTILGTVGYRYQQRHSSWTSPFGPQMRRDRFLFEELALEPKQMAAMKERAIPFRAELERQQAEIAEKKKGLIVLLRQENPDQTAISSLIAEISARQEEMQQQVAAHMLGVKGLLDKEQQQRFFNLIDAAMSKGSQTGCPSTE